MNITTFKNLPLFDQLEEKDLLMMLENKILFTISFDPGESIITEKRFDRKIYYMLQGSVKITRDVVSKGIRQQKEIKVIEGSGHYLGEITAFTGKPRTASVTAITEVTCIAIDVTLMMRASSRLLDRIKTKFYPRLFELLCKRLDETNEALVEMKQKSEELQKKVKDVTLEKMAIKQEFQEDLRKKRQELKELEDKLESTQI